MKHIFLPSSANANLQNTINLSIILHYVRERSQTYRSRISKDLGLSLPAVSRAVNILIERGLLVEKKIITKTGKQAHEVRINAEYGVVIGVSVELPNIKCARMDMAGRFLDSSEFSLSADEADLDTFIRETLQRYLQSVNSHDQQKCPILAICIGLPAAVDMKRNRINAVLFQRLKGLDLQKNLEEHFHVPILLENTENLAALAEKYYQGGIEEETFNYVAVHQGIGAGIMIEGQLYRGANGAAGEIGYQHLAIPSQSHADKSNIFERIASIHHIEKIVIEMIQSGRGESLFNAANYSYDNINHIFVGKMAASGSEEAVEALQSYAKLLAVGVSNFLLFANPERIILGGALCDIENAEEFIVKPLIRFVQELIPFPAPKISITRFGRKVIMIGAAQHALEYAILQDYPYMLSSDV